MSKEVPKKFRIFKAGWNTTQKGDFLFDDKAAKLVMAAYEEHGVERPIDLEHLSIDQESNGYDPDARGWFKLSVIDGELWAIDVRWTPDGERRLMDATQRYISPFFAYAEKTKRVEAIHNVAMVAIPATNETPALVAASAFVAASLRAGQKLAALSIKAVNVDLKKILLALGLGEDATIEDALSAIKALQEGGEGGDSEGELLKKMCKALGLADDAGEDEVMKALGDDKGEEDEKKGELAALRANVKQLTERLSVQETRNAKSDVEKLVDANPNKIPLHMEEFLKSQSVGVVNAYLKHAIEVPRETKEEKKRENKTNTALTKDEKVLAKLGGIKPEIVAAYKKKLAEKAAEDAELQ